MAHRRTFLVDTSVLNRGNTAAVHGRLAPLIESDLLVSCAIVDLEVLYSARDLREYEGVRLQLSGLLEEPLVPATFQRAREVQRVLARTGHHRLPVSDLIIAATAELGGHSVLHYDRDFERIVDVTGQAHEWVAPRGSI